MCTSTESTFAWVGAIVVNAAFITFVAWGASTIWWIGFLVSIVYTLILFSLANLLDKRDESGESDLEGEEEEEERTFPADDADAQGRRSILVSLLYGLFVIALGVTGYFLPTNIFYCPDERPRPPKKAGQWDTDISSLPDAVQPWAKSVNPAKFQATFAYLPGSKTTLFSGTNGDTQQSILWAATASVYPWRSAEPISFPNTSLATELTAVLDSKACFVSYDGDGGRKGGGGGKDNPRPVPIRKKFIVACCDGKSVSIARDNTEGIVHQSPNNLFATNGTLWYKDYPPATADVGTLIFSLDPTTMEETLHSTYHGGRLDGSSDGDDRYIPDDDERWECRKAVDRKRATLAIFVSALPVVIASILLWAKRQVSTMGVTTFVGISAMATFIYASIAPPMEAEHINDFGKWWYSIFGACWLLIMTDLFFSGRRGIDRAPLSWGINFSALVFFVAMIRLTGVLEEDILWRWAVLNLVVFLTLPVLGIATDQIFLLALCAVGFLMDSFRFAALLAQDAGPNADVPIFAVVLALAGLCIAAVGWFLSRHQEGIHAGLAGWMEEHSMSRSRAATIGTQFDALPTEDPLSEPLASSEHESYGDDEEA